MTTCNSPKNDDQAHALARDKVQLAKIQQMAKEAPVGVTGELTAPQTDFHVWQTEFHVWQAEFQVWQAELLAQAAENSRILDRLEARDRGQP